MFSFNWPLIGITSLFLYIGIIVMLPFNPLASTILLFSLIAFWTKLPGGCIMEPFPILYVIDLVDVFAVIIAIYVGPLEAASFALIWNIYPRLCGAFRPWVVFFKDGIAQALICLIMPFLHSMLGGNIVLSVAAFSVIRIPLYQVFSMILPNRSFVGHLIQSTVAGIAVLIVNSIYTTLFGNFFVSLLQNGASFSWILFFVATGVIILFSMIIYGFSPKNTGKKVVKNVAQIIKHQISKKAVKQDRKDEDMDYMQNIKDNIHKGKP